MGNAQTDIAVNVNSDQMNIITAKTKQTTDREGVLGGIEIQDVDAGFDSAKYQNQHNKNKQRLGQSLGEWDTSGSKCEFSNSNAGQDTDKSSGMGDSNDKQEVQPHKEENELNVYLQSVQTLKKVDNILDLYKFTEVLGEGAFGKVYKAKSRKHGYRCAIKKIKKDHINKKESRKIALIHEMQVLENISHHHLVRTYELLHDDKNYYIVNELAKVDLFKFYSERESLGLEPFSERQIKFVVKQLITALEYLHKNDIIHRDIKMENILVNGFRSEGPLIKLTDFGFATELKQGEKLDNRVGSRYYMAPEILNEKQYDHKVDIWAMMVCVYVLFQADMPFHGDTIDDLRQAVKNRDIINEIDNDSKWKHVSPLAKDFIKMGLSKSKIKRANLKKLLEHPWLKNTELPSESTVTAENNYTTALYLRAGHLVNSQAIEKLEATILDKDQLNLDLVCTPNEKQNLIQSYIMNLEANRFESLMDKL